ncbi:leucine-rich repeat and calponin homology domain-containing protein 3-like isoform X2 [Varroa jacobsoni]|uniref:leucine-rich repeat and calponin homology domain-containing protein 3-like isoform X2 n=1 Tax=Varroa jacobsoni TaxID=62625 RepID=UPI000BF72454|nr:leucine-rich repeat and calponin homology domain-containing protein 3-like isoform X2 [Varroa jacobsoni]
MVIVIMTVAIGKRPIIKLDKTLEEATETGVLRLNGRKLKEISLKLQSLPKYDITDTIVTDLSKNRLNELPSFVCELYQLTELSLYSNLLRSLPSDESLLTLQHLTYLNLSKNQISVIPQALCFLPKLQVLIVSHNRLCSLPEELGRMTSLYDLDVSCNEISFLPAQIVNLAALKYLDLRRNLLVELPSDLHKLTGLTRLDISENRIQNLPTDMRRMERLTEFVCDHNPLVTPPAALCTRGLNHVKKFLDNEERKRGGGPAGVAGDTGTLTQAGHRGLRSRESFQLTLRHPISKAGARDSGYTTSDGSTGYNEKRFSGAGGKDDVDAADEIRRFAAQRMEFTRSPKKPQQPLQQRHQLFGPSTQPTLTSFQSSTSSHDLCNVSPSSEAATLQATAGGPATPSTLSPTSEFKPIQPDPTMPKTGDGVFGSGDLLLGPIPGRCLTPEEELRQRREAIVAKQRAEVKRVQKEALIQFVKQRQSPLPGGGQSLTHPQQPPPPPPPLLGQGGQTQSGHPATLPVSFSQQHQQQLPQQISPTSESTPPLPNFTMRRGLDRAREEQELLGRMRAIIEARLKMALPENLAGALTDGVVLCHLANHVRPRSVATIHVPSATNPKLTMAKCRRNVDNFLDACRRLGVPPEETCESGDVLAEFDARALLTTIESFIRVAGRQSSAGIGGTSTKPTAKPPPPPLPIRSSSDPAYTGPQTGPQTASGSNQLAVNNNLPKPCDEQPPKQDPAGTGGLATVGARSIEAVSRNESPVSTSEDISNLENLEYDLLEVRLSSSKTTPPQHSSAEDTEAALPSDTSLEDEAALEGNTTFRSMPPEYPGLQGLSRPNTVEVVKDRETGDVNRDNTMEQESSRRRKIKLVGDDGTVIADSREQYIQQRGNTSSVRKLRSLFERSAEPCATLDQQHRTMPHNQKDGSGSDSRERADVQKNGHHHLNRVDEQYREQIDTIEPVKEECNQQTIGGQPCKGISSSSKNESFFTTNVKAGIGTACISLVVYLYAYHPWILILLTTIVALVLYKNFFPTTSNPGHKNDNDLVGASSQNPDKPTVDSDSTAALEQNDPARACANSRNASNEGATSDNLLNDKDSR